MITNREALAQLPVTRKAELIAGQIYDSQWQRIDYRRVARALFAPGFHKGDIVCNGFAYHLTPEGSMIDLAEQALDCAVLPAGGGQIELQVQMIAALRPDAYCGTPSFHNNILEKGREMGADLSSLKKRWS